MSFTHTVRVQSVVKEYGSGAGKVTAVKSVSFDVDTGDFLALNGPSGSGKTTLLNLIGALDRTSSGDIEIEGRSLGKLSGKELSVLRRDRIGFIFQAYNLIPILSAVENAEFTMMLQKKPLKERREKAMMALELVGLGSLAHRRPNELSGGQQQRVAIARAIAPEPAIILADEPTANLDSKTATNLLDLMKDLNERLRATFVFSTHDSRVLERAKRIIQMRDGEMIR